MNNKLSNFKNKFDKNEQSIISILIITICSALMAITTCMFLNPLGLYGGGTTGVAQIILRLFGIIVKGDWSYYQKYLSYVNFVLLLPFNLLAFFKLSKKYAIYTSISTIVQTIFYCFNDYWISLGVFKNADGSYETLTCVIMCAAINGITNGLVMRRGATSGGFTTLSQYLNLKKGKSVGGITFITSAIIMTFGATISFIAGSKDNNAFALAISTALYTLLYFVLSSVILDYVHTSYNKVKIEVVTENGTYLADELIKIFPHGITIEKGIGAYTRREKDILSIIVQRFEYRRYVNAIKDIDSKAFVAVMPVWRFTGRFNAKTIDK